MSKLQSQPIIPFYTILVLLGKGVYQFRRETCALEYALKQNCHQNLDSHPREIFGLLFLSITQIHKLFSVKEYIFFIWMYENKKYVINKNIRVIFLVSTYHKLHFLTLKGSEFVYFFHLFYTDKNEGKSIS